MMAENKRYNIKPSKIIENGFCIQDDRREHSFPTVDDKSHLIMYEKALNEQNNRLKELETVMRQILYETRANYTKEEYSATVSISPQMHDKLTELITEVK